MPRALISVSDKTGLVELARALDQAGFSLLSTGGTYRHLSDAGLDVIRVADVTGFPEILDGRVKTLHPRIHGGILARGTPEHLRQLDEHGIEPIDVVIVNLYPFQETIGREGVTLTDAVEQIDIGGPTMLRAAAKNVERVWVVVDPADYAGFPEAFEADDAEARRELARKAFAHTAGYDRVIASYLGAASAPEPEEELPINVGLELERAQTLRYGENPHLRGARYRVTGETGLWDRVVQHKGSDLSYLNIFDADAAWRLVNEFEGAACVIVKHANPCGVAIADSAAEAYGRAFEADPKSAFGGVVALNRPVDVSLAEMLMANPKADVVIAPAYSDDGLEILRSKRKAMRVLSAPPAGAAGMQLRPVSDGFLGQEYDTVRGDRSNWQVVTAAQPTEEQWRDAELAWRVCARTSSNAIVLVKDGVAVGIGAGQQSRVDAANIAAQKAAGRASGGACASDAFYPFRDGLDAAARAEVAVVIQPGGSVRDEEIIEAANEHGLAMVLTGRRHFRH